MKLHYHKCKKCDTIWRHTEAWYGVMKAHRCPKCKWPQFDACRAEQLKFRDRRNSVRHPPD